jgi:hypothetical protein
MLLLVGRTLRAFAQAKFEKPFFGKQQKKEPKALRKMQVNKSVDTEKEIFKSLRPAEEYAQASNDSNNFFKGIRKNTSYAKFYNEDTFANALNFTGRNVSDLPFLAKEVVKPAEERKASLLARNILGRVEEGKLLGVLKGISSGFFEDLVTQKRSIKIEPNFEREARRTMASLSQEGFVFKLANKN